MPETMFNQEMGEKKGLGGAGGLSRRLVFLLIILGVLVVIAVGVNLALSKPSSEAIAPEPSTVAAAAIGKNSVEILPQKQRQEANQERAYTELPLTDPFAGPMELLGIINGGPGEDLAIIQVDNGTCMVQPGDLVLNTWEVIEISQGEVLLKAGEKEAALRLRPMGD